MEEPIKHFIELANKNLSQSKVRVDAPNHKGGNWWLNISQGNKHFTLEYRPQKGFGLFYEGAGYGEGPAEIYQIPELVVKRLSQLIRANNKDSFKPNLKDIRELYGQSQVDVARRVKVKQSAISRFEKRNEVKLSTLASVVKALGGQLEVRARFSDADVPISISK